MRMSYNAGPAFAETKDRLIMNNRIASNTDSMIADCKRIMTPYIWEGIGKVIGDVEAILTTRQ